MRHAARLAGLLALLPAAALSQSIGWESFGPPLFQVSAISTPADDQTVYAASADATAGQSAIFRSTDGGSHWSGVVQAASGEFYADLLVDPGNAATLYAGAPASVGATNIYYSNNSGGSWLLGQAISGYCIPSFAPGAAAGAAFVACGTSLYGTIDAGRTWQPLPNPFTEPTRLASGPAGLLVAYGPTKIFRSANAGATWTSAGSAPAACAGLNALRVNPSNPSAFVAGTGLTGATGFQCGGIYTSANGGASWTAASLTGVSVSDVLFDPNNPARVYASADYLAGFLPRGGVFASGDGGATWSDLQLPQNGASTLGLSSGGDRLYAGTSLGVYQLALSVGPVTCVVDPVTLCLDNARFRVRATWTRSDGTSGVGHAMTLTGDTGDFWFFDSSNVELIVKVLEGCSNNAHRWVFASGLTNVLVSLTVQDVVKGTVKVYTNPQGTAFAPIQDTSAFTCP
ncbi:MAG TPA: hypothetical protein VMN82_14825 [Thermoanaerobaculia bacterium]|nr:hypothetical protein [Thermoanaerobaculia bacterium]